MLYNSIKILHIFSATLVLTSIGYSCFLWRCHLSRKIAQNTAALSWSFQLQTWGVMIPFALLQLATGFTMISLHHENLSQLWIKGSLVGFIIMISSWFAFLYFLSTEKKRMQSVMLIICVVTLFSMIFLMANKI